MTDVCGICGKKTKVMYKQISKPEPIRLSDVVGKHPVIFCPVFYFCQISKTYKRIPGGTFDPESGKIMDVDGKLYDMKNCFLITKNSPFIFPVNDEKTEYIYIPFMDL